MTAARLMSFNIRFSVLDSNVNVKGEVVDSTMERRVPLIANMIHAEKIDVLGVQEAKEGVYYGKTRTIHFAWKSRLEAALPEYACVGAQTRAHEEGGYIYYNKQKYTAVENGHFFLVKAEGSDDASLTVMETPGANADRVCSWVLLRDNATKDHFLFMDTHLSDAAAPIVEYQAGVIVDEIPKLISKMEHDHGVKNCPVILVGDMNSKPDSGAYRVYISLLRDSLLIAANASVDGSYCTSPNYNLLAEDESYSRCGNRIDYVFVSDGIKVNRYDMIHTTTNRCKYGEFLSDHNALTMNIEF